MRIKEFSEDVLETIYENRKSQVSSKFLSELMSRSLEEINEALDYLKDKNTIKVGAHTMDGNYHGIQLKAKGVDKVEERISLVDSFKDPFMENDSPEEKDSRIGNLFGKEKEKTFDLDLVTVPKKRYDFFICHASEDKESFVNGLAEKLEAKGLTVWYDNFVIEWGDDIRAKIDEGLSAAKYGIVVLSPSFLGKKGSWAEKELSGLFSRERKGKKVILPINHKVTHEQIEKYSPLLVSKKCLDSSDLDVIVDKCASLTKS